jgi:hypothetical protein
MKTLSDLAQELDVVRSFNSDAFGVEYFSKSNPQNHHFVIVRSQQELTNLKQFHRDYDFQFNVLAV